MLIPIVPSCLVVTVPVAGHLFEFEWTGKALSVVQRNAPKNRASVGQMATITI